MTQVDFYQIETAEALLMFACRLIDKIYHQGRRIHIHTENQTQSETLDDLLWSFRPDRFIPHAIIQDDAGGGLDNSHENDDEVLVKISHIIEPMEHQDTLVNLSGVIPDFFSRFERVAEVVPLAEESRAAARENYKFYKDRGYKLNYHAIKAKKT